jgi:Fur family transcriptional regulator, ferric uptake regulator
MKTSSVDQIIIEIIEKEENHLTSQQIYEKLRNHLPAVNRSTVYRSLERLAENGKVSISDMGMGASVYELVSNGIHHHLICQQCHQTILIPLEDVANFFSQVELMSRYQITTNHLILYGICDACISKNQI